MFVKALSLSALLSAGLAVAPAAAVGNAAPTATAIQLGKPLFQVPLFGGGLVTAPTSRRFFYLQDGKVQVRPMDAGAVSLLPVSDARVIALGADESLYVVDRSSHVHVFDAQLQPRHLFRVAPRPDSIAVLSNGDVVVAAAASGKLLHVFDRGGKWLRSFGPEDRGSSERPGQVSALRSVVVGADDALYYLERSLTRPQVRIFSKEGREAASLPIEGEAIDVQTAATAEPYGLTSVNGVWADRNDGALWLALNGSDRTGLLYQYDARARKVAEYRFRNADGSVPTTVHGVNVRGGRGYIVIESNVYEVDLTRSVADGWGPSAEARGQMAAAPIFAECGAAQPWGECGANCQFHNGDMSSLDCKAALADTLTTGYVVVGSNCTNAGGPPATCQAGVTICVDGTNSDHNKGLTCDAYCSHGCPPGYSEHCQGQEPPDQCGCCFDYSPIVVDLRRDGLSFSGPAAGVLWDPNGLGTFRWVGWPLGVDDALLARDLDHNGLIDSGAELFGNTTRLIDGGVAAHGYAALADLDENGDGWVDGADSAFGELLLWLDRNHNGVSEAGELLPLSSHYVVGLSTRFLESSHQDQWGNRFRYWSWVRASVWPYLRLSSDVFPASLPVQ